MREMMNIEYKSADGALLLMDLFLPDEDGFPPLILWIHGGAWEAGDRKWCLLKRQAERGYAVASVDYRLSGQAPFPAQIIDCKDALIYLKANAGLYGFDPNRVAVGGDSAGGHLAALIGTSAGQRDWEPEGADTTVKAVVDYYGPILFTKEWPNAARLDSPECRLLDAHVQSPLGRARSYVASPIAYINGAEPPFLILHGDKDPLVPIGQSRLLRNELEAAGGSVAMHRVFGGGHGFQSESADRAVDEFLDYHLKREEAI